MKERSTMSISDLKILEHDQLQRAYVQPNKILSVGDGVTNAELLLTASIRQIYVGVPQTTKISSCNGKRGTLLLDFGSEMVGSLELLVSSTKQSCGSRLHIRFGESVSEAMTKLSDKNATNDHAVRDMSVLVTPLSQQVIAYTGYRFVYIELEDNEDWVDLAAVYGVLTYRDIPYQGTFECNDLLLNRIYDVCSYTVHLNMQNMLWDGIKRDRLVWIGDIHPEMLAIRTVFGSVDVVDKSLSFVAETNPLPQWPNQMTTYGLWYLLILWDWYWYNGNKDLILQLENYWKGLLIQLLALVHKDREDVLDEDEFGAGFFVDWPTKGTIEAKAGAYALFRLAMLASAKLCQIIGDTTLMEECQQAAKLLQKPSLPHNNRKQIVALMQLADMANKDIAAQVLTKSGGHGMSTFMSYYILSAVEKSAGIDDALEMLREYYGAMLDTGATTFWEDFDLDWMKSGARIDKILQSDEYDIHGENGRFCYEGMRHSLCHGWSAGPAAFLMETILGIQILEAGCRKILVKPSLGSLSWAKGTYPTPYGIIKIEVSRSGEQMFVNVEAPDGIEIIT